MLALDEKGFVKVIGFSKNGTSLEATIPNIYAAGDITSIGAGRIQPALAQGVQALIQAMHALHEK